MPIVFVPGKGNVQFPDDMDMDNIRWTIENRILGGVPGGEITAPKAPEGTIINAIKGIGAEIAAFPERTQRLISDIIDIPKGAYEAFGIKPPPDAAERARREALYGKVASRPLYEQRAATAEAEVREATPQFEGIVPSAAYSAASSLAQMAPGLAASVLTRSPAPAYANIMAITAPEAYGRYRDRGGTKAEALTGAGLETGIEVATEMLPLGFVVNKLGKAGFGEFMRGFLGRELIGEEIATITQGAVDTAIANPDKTWGDYLQELPSQMAETAIATGLTAGALAGVSKGLQAFSGAEPSVSVPGGPGGAAVPPPPAAPVTPPGEDLLDLLGQEGGTIRLREGDTEVPYVFRGVDDTGRILLEGGDGVLFAEDPADIADVLIPTEPPVSPAGPAPPPEAPPATSPPGVSPIAEPVVPVEPETPTPPEAPTATPVEPVLPEPLPEPEPQPEPEPEPIAPPSAPQIRDEQTRDYWRSNLDRQREQVQAQVDTLSQQPDAEPAQIETLNQRLAEIEEDYRGIERGEAPIPRARPLDDTTASIVAEPNAALADAIRDLPAVGVMDWFAKNGTTDFHRELATRVGGLMKAMEQAGFEFNWGVYDQNYQPKDGAERDNYNYVMKKPRVMGAAWTHSKEGAALTGKAGRRVAPDYAFDRVDIGVKGPGLLNSGANEVTILHEFAHAVTVAAIDQLRSKKISPNSRVGQAVKELRSLKRSAVTHKNKLLKDIANGKQVDPRLAQALQNLESTNAWDNEKELIVQGLTNIDMQIVLKSMPYKKTNGFVEFIREIGRMIGVSEKDMNGLRRLFELTDELIPTDTAAQQEVIQAMMRPGEYSQAAVTPSEAEAPTAAAILTPEEDAQRITNEAANAPAADSMEALKEAAQPAIRLYNIRSELQEKNRGCD